MLTENQSMFVPQKTALTQPNNVPKMNTKDSKLSTDSKSLSVSPMNPLLLVMKNKYCLLNPLVDRLSMFVKKLPLKDPYNLFVETTK